MQLARYKLKSHDTVSPHERILTAEAKLEQLEDFAIKNGGVGVANFARSLFPELVANLTIELETQPLELPTTAPERYQGLRGPESPPEFVKRVYGDWLGKGLDRAHIRNLDHSLSTAIDNWSRKNEWPEDIDLPTRSEQNRRVVERLRAQAPGGDISKVIGEFTLREAERIRAASRRIKDID